MASRPDERTEDDAPDVEGHSWRPRRGEDIGREIEADDSTPERGEDDGPEVEGHSWRPRNPSE